MNQRCPHLELIFIHNEESRKIALVQCEDCGEFVAYTGEMWREDLREEGRRFLELRGITDLSGEAPPEKPRDEAKP